MPVTAATADDMDALKHAVLRGMKEEAAAAAAKRLTDTQPLALIDTQIIPALNEIGTAFEEKRAYLPQLLMSAEAASAAFDVIRGYMPKNDENSGRAVILATVKGDIHDIGKNIVRVLLESYGFIVYDLGRDTEPAAVLAAVRETGCKFVGLSALMTTTVPAMAETIELLHREENGVFVVVGGAVLNADYAEMICADLYCADAMETVRAAEHYYSCVENN